MAVQTNNIPEIKINGKILEEYIIVEVTLAKELLKPNVLRFSMRKKDATRNTNDISFSIANNLLGADVECKISTEYNNKDSEEITSENLTFKGLIGGVNSKRESMSGCVVIECVAYSPDYLLIDDPHCYSFENYTLNGIVSKCIEDYSDTITTEISPKMSEVIHYSVQYNETTYEFISRLAQRYGEFFYFENGSMVFGKIKQTGKITLYPDIDILSYHYELNLDHSNFAHIHHNYIDNRSEKINSGGNYSQDLHKLSDSVTKHSNSLYKKETIQNYLSSVQEENDVSQLDESVKTHELTSKTQMMICKARTNRCDLKIGSVVTIQEYTDDNDNHELKNHEELLVCSVNYRWNIDGHFESEFMAIPGKAEYPPYPNCDVFPVSEAQRAVVMDNKDPEQMGRVRVQFSWQEIQDSDLMTPWIRIAQAHGGDGKGSYIIPEIGEEVMVGFENGNAEKPYVIGTLYHGAQRPEGNWYSDSNDIKAFRTRNGHTVEVHDVGEGGYIRIYDHDQENYILTYSTDEKLIKLESKGNIELYADNDIIMKAGNDMKIEVGHDYEGTIDNDQKVWVKVDQNVHVGNNQQLKVDEDQQNSISGNQDSRVGKKSSLQATDIVIDASQKVQMLSQTHEQKADSKMALDGGSLIDMKAGNVKIN